MEENKDIIQIKYHLNKMEKNVCFNQMKMKIQKKAKTKLCLKQERPPETRQEKYSTTMSSEVGRQSSLSMLKLD